MGFNSAYTGLNIFLFYPQLYVYVFPVVSSKTSSFYLVTETPRVSEALRIKLYSMKYIYIYIYIYSAVLKRLATPSDFHIPLPSIVPLAHS